MQAYTIQNNYIKLITLDYGATIHQLITKDRNGNDINVILSFKNPDGYRHNKEYLGASVGRFAGRIEKNGFSLNNIHHQLYTDNGVHLHGGKEGFSFKKWNVEAIEEGNNPFIRFSYLSEHNEEGYPGNLKVFCTYQLETNKLNITYEAESDRDTIVNLTNHNYYNLNGNDSILNHDLFIAADKILIKDENFVSNGHFLPLDGTHYDFRKKTRIADQFKIEGIDDCYVVTEKNPLVILYSEKTGIEMSVSSNQPGVVVYTPEYLDENKFLNTPLNQYPAICFETQSFPNAPNQPHFPPSVLKKGDTYKNKSSFSFSIK